ncbi:alpha/beta hydrolase-fold protein [Nocardioides sp.]|uniref:carboxylesterase family protein n=1 Tax=Nocardioides sp. TaxID=35761 RepID=UPI0019946F9C|nr:alpha/beta hydrolase-fold protein [Nocardioides sp.]MBC7279193.1 prolyl oligopeptidase family serine peptidase [Nocardioides sp.]
MSSSTTDAAQELIDAGIADAFTQETFNDSETGEALSYNIFLPADYDPTKAYPMVLYIADSSLVGQDVTAPLNQYGALIWASEAEQAKHESIVVVPEYPSVIIDDHGSFTTTDYVDMTARLVQNIGDEYNVDTDRVYGTGQSMGAMTVMYLAAQQPELFAAELIVSGQWDPDQLQGLTEETFTYVAAAGDENSSGGQSDVEALLDDAGVAYATGSDWDATWDTAKLDAAAQEMYASGDAANFATFAAGTVLTASGQSADSSGAGSSEHMASFEPAYKIEALRDWLFEQSAA